MKEIQVYMDSKMNIKLIKTSGFMIDTCGEGSKALINTINGSNVQTPFTIDLPNISVYETLRYTLSDDEIRDIDTLVLSHSAYWYYEFMITDKNMYLVDNCRYYHSPNYTIGIYSISKAFSAGFEHGSTAYARIINLSLSCIPQHKKYIGESIIISKDQDNNDFDDYNYKMSLSDLYGIWLNDVEIYINIDEKELRVTQIEPHNKDFTNSILDKVCPEVISTLSYDLYYMDGNDERYIVMGWNELLNKIIQCKSQLESNISSILNVVDNYKKPRKIVIDA